MGCMTSKKTQNFTMVQSNLGSVTLHMHTFLAWIGPPKSGFPRSFEASHIKYLDVRHSYTATLAITLVLVCLENVVGSRQNYRCSWHEDHRYRVGYWKLGSSTCLDPLKLRFTFTFQLFFVFFGHSKTVHVLFMIVQLLIRSSVNNISVHYLWTHKLHVSITFSLKIGPTILFTHLKIIFLQYFQFSVFSFSKINSIQTQA